MTKLSAIVLAGGLALSGGLAAAQPQAGGMDQGGPGGGTAMEGMGHGGMMEGMRGMEGRRDCPMMSGEEGGCPMMGADGAAGADHGAHGPQGEEALPGSPATQAYRAANQAMHEAMDLAFTDDADIDFARGMIGHHQGAIDMARVVLEHGRDPDLRALAEEVIEAQEAEIAFLRGWLAEQGL